MSKSIFRDASALGGGRRFRPGLGCMCIQKLLKEAREESEKMFPKIIPVDRAPMRLAGGGTSHAWRWGYSDPEYPEEETRRAPLATFNPEAVWPSPVPLVLGPSSWGVGIF